MVDLTKTDIYEDYNVPDNEVEICLKVIRTIRTSALFPDRFDADTAVILSHAHKQIHDYVDALQSPGDNNNG